MKKVMNLLLILAMLLSLAGCFPGPGPSPDPDPDPDTEDVGLNQEELWDFLKDKCFITEYGILDYAYYFKGCDEFIISADHLNHGQSYYFSDLIDFKYDGNNTYILEYENNYDAFPHGIFVLIFNPKESDRLEIYQDMYGDRVSVTLFEDKPLSVEEILAVLKQYKYWYYTNYDKNDCDYYIYIDDCCNDEFNEALVPSEFTREGDIVEAEYLGVTLYNVTFYYHGHPGSGLIDYYDYYYSVNRLAVSPYVDFIGYDTEMQYEDLKIFYPEIGLTLDELFRIWPAEPITMNTIQLIALKSGQMALIMC